MAYLYEAFKYISCSYLSTCFLHFYIQLSNLNTSHVLIYRGCTLEANKIEAI